MSLEQLMQIKVSIAARKSESWLSSSGTVYLITRDDILNYGWRDLKEILASVPNMDLFYQWSWLPGGQRGFTGNMAGTLLLIDGREVQNLLANEAFIMNNFPASRIERIEVLQGPNSTLYGGNASQGVINVVTRLQNDFSESEISGLVGEANTQHIHVLSNHTKGDWGFSISGSHFVSDQDYSEIREFVVDDENYSRNSIINNLRSHDPDLFRNKERNFTLDSQVNYKSSYLGTNITRAENVSGIERPNYDFISGDDSRRGYGHYYLGSSFEISEEWNGFSEISYFREYKEKDRLNARNADTANSYDELDLFNEQETIKPSTRYRFRTQFEYNQENLSWILGYDGWRTQIGRKTRYVDTPSGVVPFTPPEWPSDKEKSYKHAIYAQYVEKHQLSKDASLTTTFGIRYNQQDFTDSKWLPRLSVVYQPDETSAWKFTYGKAFRPPTIFEFEGVENDEIDSQTMDMFEINYSRQWIWNDLKLANISTLYDMEAKNFYQKVFDNVAQIWLTQVSGQHRVKGFESLLKWQGQNWGGQVGFRHAMPDEVNINGATEALDVPTNKVKLGIHYYLNTNWRVGMFMDHWSSTYTEANTLDGLDRTIYEVPSWTTLNLNILSSNNFLKRGQDFSYGIYIENLFDETYYHSNARGTSPIQYIQAPRNIRLHFSLHFQ
ncbi:TonB-dependent siderophore receptor [Pleionea sp. CnH1-48]|uniref:TonB-dependent receptor plug domain-containing protein n=1 Tax=Pleionea sp. CnH1-48 TaxID=2954494 RepID=UPI002097E426|nr:TonB-dependent receptor [Pleionea sp. CnH1-48]MCO7225146.1 TonB-dependent receptor [Pleionea sp. CnH1-48]